MKHLTFLTWISKPHIFYIIMLFSFNLKCSSHHHQKSFVIEIFPSGFDLWENWILDWIFNFRLKTWPFDFKAILVLIFRDHFQARSMYCKKSRASIGVFFSFPFLSFRFSKIFHRSSLEFPVKLYELIWNSTAYWVLWKS